MNPAPSKTDTGLFYGWKIVAVCFVTLFVSVGFGFYSFGAFFKALASELGGSRFGIGIGLAVFSITNGVAAPFLGRAVSHGSIRNIMSAGVVLLTIGFVVISQVQTLLQFYIVLGTLMALGAALIGGLTASSLVANWFVRKRGMALGIATMGISLSGVVMAPAATWLIDWAGWRHTFLIYAALTLVVILPAVRALVINRPEDIGQHPDGDAEGPSGSHETHSPLDPQTGYSWHSALRDRNFWVITIGVSLSMSANGAILIHLIPHTTDLGFSPTKAALVLSFGAGLGVLGKILFGWISDHIDKRSAIWISSALQGVAAVVFLFAESYPMLLLGGAIFGLGMGGLVPLWGTLIGASFGRRAFGRVMGLMSPFMLPIQTVGVPLAGLIYDKTGSYDVAFGLFIGVYAAAIVVLGFLRIPAEVRATPAPNPATC